jgi:hypothetical protein
MIALSPPIACGVRDEDTILSVCQRCREHPWGVRDEETILETVIEFRGWFETVYILSHLFGELQRDVT